MFAISTPFAYSGTRYRFGSCLWCLSLCADLGEGLGQKTLLLRDGFAADQPRGNYAVSSCIARAIERGEKLVKGRERQYTDGSRDRRCVLGHKFLESGRDIRDSCIGRVPQEKGEAGFNRLACRGATYGVVTSETLVLKPWDHSVVLRHEPPPILSRCTIVRGDVDFQRGHLGYRVRFHGHVDDDTKRVPSTSADSPVDVIVLAFIRCDQVAIGRDDSGLEDVIRPLAVFSS